MSGLLGIFTCHVDHQPRSKAALGPSERLQSIVFSRVIMFFINFPDSFLTHLGWSSSSSSCCLSLSFYPSITAIPSSLASQPQQLSFHHISHSLFNLLHRIPLQLVQHGSRSHRPLVATLPQLHRRDIGLGLSNRCPLSMARGTGQRVQDSQARAQGSTTPSSTSHSQEVGES